MRYLKFSFFSVIILGTGYLLFYFLFIPRRTICRMVERGPTISAITFGDFTEFIPQTGRYDTSNHRVITPIDELYAEKMSNGLKATTSFNGVDYSLEVTDVHREVVNGRFSVELKFDSVVTDKKLRYDQSLRLRIQLGETKQALLLPVGGFYKDTHGKWVYIIKGERAVKHGIKLGRKNAEHFEVLDGLNAGDSVIISSYENYGKFGDEIEMDELEK